MGNSRRRPGRLLEWSVRRIDDNGKAHVYLDRTPLTGFTGYLQLAPCGVQAQPPSEKPRRPGLPSHEADEAAL